MKISAIEHLRRRLAADQTALGLWVTLESPSITEMAVALGLDWVVIDAEHGHLDWKEIVEHLRATVRSDTVALVRVAQLNSGLIKRALDIGADGVVVPWIETVEQLRQAVAYARYPLEGVRGIGAERATCWGQCFSEHAAHANQHVLVVPIIETVRAVRHVPRMCQVEGVELFFFGPADFSSTAGFRGQWEGPGVAQQILQLKDAIRAAGKHCGLVATSIENLCQRQAQGFRAIGIGLDAGMLFRSLRTTLAALGRDRPISASLAAASEAAPLERPPEAMRPDRPETMTRVGEGPQTEIAAGVRFECLVGSHNQARRLTTGIVTFAPGAVLPYHLHSFAEAITLLDGAAQAEVEGRGYALRRLDCVAVPAGQAHSVRNRSTSEPAVFHIAMATDSPTRTLVEKFFPKRPMPDDSPGHPGAERVTRCAGAPRGVAGPGAEFIDCYNDALLAGCGMSGGYGLFQQGGRLPAHVHDFDESITIIAGSATCIVEGRRYELADCATALQPRGRVHYFRNDAAEPMEMIWVYAGPRPERIVVAERCATAEGNPWK